MADEKPETARPETGNPGPDRNAWMEARRLATAARLSVDALDRAADHGAGTATATGGERETPTRAETAGERIHDYLTGAATSRTNGFSKGMEPGTGRGPAESDGFEEKPAESRAGTVCLAIDELRRGRPLQGAARIRAAGGPAKAGSEDERNATRRLKADGVDTRKLAALGQRMRSDAWAAPLDLKQYNALELDYWNAFGATNGAPPGPAETQAGLRYYRNVVIPILEASGA